MKTKNLIYTAVFAALIFIVTAYILHIPIPTTTGYIHLGDTIIYVAAAIIPTPYAVVAACIGAGLCDMIFAPIYVLPTLIIKSLICICFTSKNDKTLCKRNFLAILLSLVITILGYYITDTILYFNFDFVKGVASIPMNLIQSISSGIAFIIIVSWLDKLNLKKHFRKDISK